jgi:hypothetical protein
MTKGRAVPVQASRRNAAMIASAIVLPLVVILALLFSAGSSGDSNNSASDAVLGPVTAVAPPSDTATAPGCIAVLAALPIELTADLPARAVDSASPFVVAWGDPAVVLRCGVAKPSGLVPLSDRLVVVVGGVSWFSSKDGGKDDDPKADTIFTAIDRSVYIEVRVPPKWIGYPLPVLSAAVAKALPTPVCSVQNAAGTIPKSGLCTYR